MTVARPYRKQLGSWDSMPGIGMAMLFLAMLFVVAPQSVYAKETVKPTVSNHVVELFGEPPAVPAGDLSPELQKALDLVFDEGVIGEEWSTEQIEALVTIGESGDPRLGWIISDMMRFASQSRIGFLLATTVSLLLDIDFENGNHWGKTTDHLMAWNIPEPPNYLKYKRGIYTTLVPGWDRIFVDGDIDWRHVSWGGVLIDDRPFDRTDEECNCIPAADNPKVTDVAGAKWLKDKAVVFGLEVNGEFRAYPRQIMEVREMVNDTLGGRNLGIPYCTLCAAAQAYYTDGLAEGIERPVLRTSGLLIRSNKVMYDVNTYSVFDTFLGKAVTGPLAEKNVQLKQASMITTTWGEWKKAHPKTTVLAEELALGRDFDFRNGRDADGPIFPVGDTDPRLPIHEDIIGIVTKSGTAVAFPRTQAMVALSRGEKVEYENIELKLSAGGVKAVDEKGADAGSHQAFWFAWSQFHPETKLWVN